MVNPSALASDVPTWIKFCSNTAPMASLVVFMAVCKNQIKMRGNEVKWLIDGERKKVWGNFYIVNWLNEHLSFANRSYPLFLF